jgi:hypothetical protein
MLPDFPVKNTSTGGGGSIFQGVEFPFIRAQESYILQGPGNLPGIVGTFLHTA